jgi:hypothetical protein
VPGLAPSYTENAGRTVLKELELLTTTRLKWAVLALGLSLMSTLAADDPAAKKTTPIDKGQRVYCFGHSLLHVTGAFGPTLRDVAALAGIKDHVQAGTWPTGSYAQDWKQPIETSKVKQALRDRKVDVLALVAMARSAPDRGIDEFARFALEHNPDIRIALQVSWLQFDEPGPRSPAKVDWSAATGADLRKKHAAYFKNSADQVEATNKQLGKPVLLLVPVGQATIALREKIIAGQVPGLTQQADLFSDHIGHAREPLKVLLAYCHFAVIYRRSPVGLPMPKLLTQAKNPDWDEKLNRQLQELAWEAVIHEPLSGVKDR